MQSCECTSHLNNYTVLIHWQKRQSYIPLVGNTLLCFTDINAFSELKWCTNMCFKWMESQVPNTTIMFVVTLPSRRLPTHSNRMISQYRTETKLSQCEIPDVHKQENTVCSPKPFQMLISNPNYIYSIYIYFCNSKYV